MRRKLTKSSHNSKMIWTLFIAAKVKRTDKMKRTGVPSNMVPCHSLGLRLPCYFLLLWGYLFFFSAFSNISRNSGAPSWERSSLSEISQWDLYCCLWLLRHNAAFSGTNCLNITDFLFHKALSHPTPGRTMTPHEERQKENWINV